MITGKTFRHFKICEPCVSCKDASIRRKNSNINYKGETTMKQITKNIVITQAYIGASLNQYGQLLVSPSYLMRVVIRVIQSYTRLIIGSNTSTPSGKRACSLFDIFW